MAAKGTEPTDPATANQSSPPAAGARPAQLSTGPAGRPATAWSSPDHPDYPYGPPPPPAGINRFAIAAFILGLIGGAPVSVVLGCIALSKTRKTGQRGKGLALTGLGLSGLWIVVVIAMVTADKPAVRNADGAVTEKGQLSVFDLRVGDCFNDPAAGTQNAKIETVSALPCVAAHNAEVVALVSVDDGDAYPGAEALFERAGYLCASKLDDYVVDALSLPEGTRVRWFVPRAGAWSRGQRVIVCVAVTGTATVNRSIREDATTLDADQLRYLAAVKKVNDLRARMEADDPPPSETELVALIRQMPDALTAASTTLRAGPWPASAQPAIDRLASEIEVSIPLWQQASKAASDAEVRWLADRADRQTGHEATVAVRRALGLSTFQGERPPRRR